MHYKPEEIPILSPDVGTGSMRSIKAGDSGMEIGASWCHQPMDTTDFYKGLPGDTCPCDHFGYVVSGKFRVKYLDGTEESIGQGEVYYIPKGHFFIYDEATMLIEINPHKELRQLMEHFNVGLAQAKEEGLLPDNSAQPA